MVASDFEYRHRFWLIVLVYIAAYAFYNLDHLNILYSLVPWNAGVLQRDVLVRFVYTAAALLAAVGAILLTWSTRLLATQHDQRSHRLLYRRTVPPRQEPALFVLFSPDTCVGYVSEPHRLWVMLIAETILLLRVAAREELLLDQDYGERFRLYAQRVPRFLPALRPRVENDGHLPQRRQALWDQAFRWGFVATLFAFASTLSDPIGYAFGSATIGFLVLQKLAQAFWIRPRRTYNS